MTQSQIRPACLLLCSASVYVDYKQKIRIRFRVGVILSRRRMTVGNTNSYILIRCNGCTIASIRHSSFMRQFHAIISETEAFGAVSYTGKSCAKCLISTFSKIIEIDEIDKISIITSFSLFYRIRVSKHVFLRMKLFVSKSSTRNANVIYEQIS